MINILTVFIGYDERQPEAFKACQQSILETSSRPVAIFPIKHQSLRNAGLFNRPWKTTETGEFIDLIDGKPFSTQFSHSRFLVPYLARSESSYEYSIFVDSDFVFLTDIHKLVDHVRSRNKNYPVHCVKHEYSPDSEVKMDNRNQFNYNKKLWTSLMVFEVNSKKLDPLDIYAVNTATGRDLHQFKWLGAFPENDIGNIPETWNFIPEHSEKNVGGDEPINAIHYTTGTPHMEGYENCDYAEWYWGAYTRAIAFEASQIADARFKKINVNNG